MNIKTTDLCDACEEAQVCELAFIGFGKKQAFAGDIRTVHVGKGACPTSAFVKQIGVLY
jgi:regulator of ribonuclease activity A